MPAAILDRWEAEGLVATRCRTIGEALDEVTAIQPWLSAVGALR